MPQKSISGYFKYLAKNKKEYINFNKQLLIADGIGVASGFAAAELTASATKDEATISGISSAVDYIVSILGFLLIWYLDKKKEPRYKKMEFWKRLKKITWSALRLWPSVALGDVAFIFSRPIAHYQLLLTGIEPGIASIIAHFIAFLTFNVVATISRSLVDYIRGVKY